MIKVLSQKDKTFWEGGRDRERKKRKKNEKKMMTRRALLSVVMAVN